MKNINSDEIEVSLQLDKVIRNAIKEGYKENKKRKYRNELIAASLSIILIGTVINGDLVYASVDKIKNVIESFFYQGEKSDISFEGQDTVKTIIGKTIEDKGIKVTLNEFYIDSDTIYMTTNLDSRERSGYAQGIEPVLYINDKKLNENGSSYSLFIHNDDGTVDILSSFKLDDFNINQQMDIKIVYDEVQVSYPWNIKKIVKGEWGYDFKVSGNELSEKIIVKDSSELKLEDGTPLINKVIISPIQVSIKVKRNDKYYFKSFKVYDDVGKEYKCVASSGNKSEIRYSYIFDTTKTSSITIVPQEKEAEPIVIKLR